MTQHQKTVNQIRGITLGLGTIATVFGAVVIESKYHDVNSDAHFQPIELVLEPHTHSEVPASDIRNLPSTGYANVGTPSPSGLYFHDQNTIVNSLAFNGLRVPGTEIRLMIENNDSAQVETVWFQVEGPSKPVSHKRISMKYKGKTKEKRDNKAVSIGRISYHKVAMRNYTRYQVPKANDFLKTRKIHFSET